MFYLFVFTNISWTLLSNLFFKLLQMLQMLLMFNLEDYCVLLFSWTQAAYEFLSFIIQYREKYGALAFTFLHCGFMANALLPWTRVTITDMSGVEEKVGYMIQYQYLLCYVHFLYA